MATMQEPFPGSKSHMELCKRNFTNHILPHLQPRVKDVFQSHFADSYGLIRALSHERGEFQMGIALSAVGIKGFELVEPQAIGLLRHNAGRLIALGMSCRTLRSGSIEVFNPELVGPMLTHIFGMRDNFRNTIKQDLEKFACLNRKSYPYDLLIWSSFIPPGKYTEFAPLDESVEMDRKYHLGCLVPAHLVDLGRAFIPRVTTAVALVQQILGRTSEGIQKAGLEIK